MEFKPETLEKIERLVPRYPTLRSALLPLLHLIQEDQGYISDESMEWIADRLELQAINVLEVVTFYPMFRRKPIGKAHVRVCRTLSCALAGAYQTCRKFEEQLGCEVGHTNAEGTATLEFVECHADCGAGPVVMIGETLYENVDEAMAATLADKIKKGEL